MGDAQREKGERDETKPVADRRDRRCRYEAPEEQDAPHVPSHATPHISASTIDTDLPLGPTRPANRSRPAVSAPRGRWRSIDHEQAFHARTCRMSPTSLLGARLAGRRQAHSLRRIMPHLLPLTSREVDGTGAPGTPEVPVPASMPNALPATHGLSRHRMSCVRAKRPARSLQSRLAATSSDAPPHATSAHTGPPRQTTRVSRRSASDASRLNHHNSHSSPR